MRSKVHVVTSAQFQAWIKSQLSASSGGAGGTATAAGSAG
jgi:heme/copper-type cytochrome/quinol oxidase subunit 2